MYLSSKITAYLIQCGIVKSEDYGLYQYSINAFLELGSNVFLTVIIGILLNKIILTLLFLGIVIPVRSIIGGCHAKTTKACFLLSIAVYLICVFSSVYLTDIPDGINFAVVIVCGILICCWAPVDCVQKPITSHIRKKMSLYSKISVTVLWIMFVIFSIFEKKQMILMLTMVMGYFVITLFVERCKKRK